MRPIRAVVGLSQGNVTLSAWGEGVAEAHIHDLLVFEQTLAKVGQDWENYTRSDIDERVWGVFWRLVNASLYQCELPRPLGWKDRWLLIEAMYELNEVGVVDPKREALTQRSTLEIQNRVKLRQGQMTPQ